MRCLIRLVSWSMTEAWIEYDRLLNGSDTAGDTNLA